MNTEYVRNLHSNYVRLTLEEKPEEKRYQYCIVNRGGIKGLLPCSLRYIDGGAYLYYDITSKQNLVQLYQRGNISREWLLDFVESLRRLQQELGRFLLQEGNVIWEPRHVFQDLESNVFSFLYVPYYSGENQFLQLVSFLVEKIDYEDNALVECVYKMYEQVERNGEIYLQEQIFKDVKLLEDWGEKKKQAQKDQNVTEGRRTLGDVDGTGQKRGSSEQVESKERLLEKAVLEKNPSDKAQLDKVLSDRAQQEKTMQDSLPGEKIRQDRVLRENASLEKDLQEREEVSGKRFFGFFENKKGKKAREQEKREEYRETMQQLLGGYAVAEETEYAEEYGRTTFMTQKPEKKDTVHRLYYADGRKASELETPNLLIGKYREKVDLYLEEESVSRMHARILRDQDQYFLEDENSTNGTYCNKTRLQPYERRRLEPGDELRIGNVTLFFR